MIKKEERQVDFFVNRENEKTKLNKKHNADVI